MGLATRSEFDAAGRYRASWVARSQFAVGLAAQPSGFPDRPSLAEVLSSTCAPLFEFRRPSGPCPNGASRVCAPFDAFGDAFPGLWFPLTRAACEVRRFTGVTCPPPSALRVWLPSRRFAPSRASPTLFRVGSAYGILPSERSPLPRLAGVFHQLRPAYRYSEPPPPIDRSRRQAAAPARPVSGYCLGRVPCVSPGCLAPNSAGCSHGFFLPRGLAAPALAEISLRLLPRASASQTVTRPIVPGAPECQSASGESDPKAGHPSQGFCATLLPALGVRLRARAMCSPRDRRRVTTPTASRSLGRHDAYRSCLEDR
jgi:hypothetical protein